MNTCDGNRAIAGASDQVGVFRHRHDEPHRSADVDANLHTSLGLHRLDDDAVAVLGGRDLQRLGLGLAARAALDGDADHGLVPGRDFDGAVKRLERQLGLAGDGKGLFFLADVVLGAQVDRASGPEDERRPPKQGPRRETSALQSPFHRSGDTSPAVPEFPGPAGTWAIPVVISSADFADFADLFSTSVSHDEPDRRRSGSIEHAQESASTGVICG